MHKTQNPQGHWADPNANLPRNNNEIVTAETSKELLSLFSRRRELLIQSAILTAAASTVLYTATHEMPTLAGISAASYVSFFLFAGSLLFCLRFIQLHAGISFNAIRFSVVEHHFYEHLRGNRVTSASLESELNQTAAPRLASVSALTIFFFTLLTGLSAVIYTSCYQNGTTTKAGIWLLVVSALTAAFALSHSRVAGEKKRILSAFQDGTLCVNPTEHEIRAHYIDSLADTQADMLAITTTVALVTVANVAAISTALQPEETMPTVTKAPLLFSTSGVLLAAIVIAMHVRMRRGITKFCRKLQIEPAQPFEQVITDTRIGMAVLISFFSINVGLAVLVAGLQANLPKDTVEQMSLISFPATFLIVAAILFFQKAY